MKTALNTFKMTSIAVVAAFMLSFSTAPVNNDTNASEMQLQFVGKVENLPVFRLALNNAVASDYLVSIKDANGDVLFRETLHGKNIARIYKLDTESAEQISGTTFEVQNKETTVSTTYKISNYSRLVEKLEVAKL